MMPTGPSQLRTLPGQRFGLAATAFALVLAGTVVWVVSQGLARDREARAAFPMVSGKLRVEGLTERLEIARDGRAIPHVLAENGRDAWFGLGFVHAQDRLAQMVWLRRLAQGRTAEWVGEAGLPADRLARTVGFARLAEVRARVLEDDVRDVLEAYVAGINARIARIQTGRVAPPTALRRHLAPLVPAPADGESMPAPTEPFTVADCLAIGKLVAWSAGASHERPAVMSDLIERLGSVAARPFFPVDPNVGAGSALSLSRDLAALPEVSGELERVRRLAPFAAAALRGTAWAVPGALSASGSPILVAELSVAPTAPSLLYEAHVRGGAVDIAGVTIPGLPVFFAGRNAEIAWAAIPLPVVAVDLFGETVRLRRPEAGRRGSEPGAGDERVLHYQNGSRWVPVEERFETLRVGRVDEEVLRIRQTRHGPLVDGLLEGRQTREPLALSWTGARPGDGLTGLLRVAQSRDAEGLREALRAHQEPPIELVFAERAGPVGLQVAGWLPRRAIPSGLVPVPGRLRAFDWRVPIDPAALPALTIPDEAAAPQVASSASPAVSGEEAAGPADGPSVITTGTRLAGELSGVSIEWLWRDERRPERIEQLLSDLASGGGIDLREAATVADDVAANVGPTLLPAIYALAGEPPLLSAEALEVIELLRRWDGQADVESRGTPAFELFLSHLVAELLEEPLGQELLDRYLALPGVRPEGVVRGILVAAARGDTGGTWMDPERVSASVREGLRRTWMSLSYRLGHNRERWTWGRLHQLEFRPFEQSTARVNEHGFSLAGALGAASALEPGSGRSANLGPFGLAGRGESIASADHDRVTFLADRVSTYRLAVDLASTNRLLTTLAPGQSEHPEHRNFADRIADWRSGNPSMLVTSPFLLEEAAVDRLVLEPPR